MKRVFITFFALFVCILSFAQKITVTCRVVDGQNGEALPYADVYAMTSAKGTITNHDGDFTIEADKDETIRIGMVGYENMFIKASEIKKVIRLSSWTISLQEVQVEGWEYILMKVSKDLTKQAKNHSTRSSDYFFRMLTTCQNKEQTEAFAVANSVANLRSINIIKGQHARKNDDTNNPILNKMNIHHLLEAGPWIEGVSFWKTLIRPLTPKTSIDYLQKYYNIKGEILEDSNKKLYYRITLERLPKVDERILTGVLYLDATTRKMLRFEGEMENMLINTTLRGINNFAPGEYKVIINYRNDKKGVTDVANIAAFIKSGDVKSQALLFNVDDMNLKLNRKHIIGSVGENVISKVSEAGFDDELWEKTQIVKRTEEEEKVLSLSNDETQANSIPLLGYKIGEDVWDRIGRLGKNADPRLSNFVDRLARFGCGYAQEKVYLHMDNTSYYVGDKIWFCAYTRSAFDNLPSSVSGTLYVELLNQEGYLLERQNVALVDGRGWGNFTLKPDYYGGFYEIRAYTRWQLNWGVHDRKETSLDKDDFVTDEQYVNYNRDYDKLYSRVFPVYDAVKEEGKYLRQMSLRPVMTEHKMDKTLSLSLYPEGGNLVAGLPSRVAYEAVWSDGEDVQLADRPNRGIIEVTPSLDEEKEIVFYDINNNKVTAKLPVPKAQGATLRASQTDSEWNFGIRLSSGIDKDKVAVTIMNQGILEKVYAVRDSVDVISVKKNLLSEGVNQITIFDAGGCVLADRLFFNTIPEDENIAQHPNFSRMDVSQRKSDGSYSTLTDSMMFDAYEHINLLVKSQPKACVSLAIRDADNLEKLNDNASFRTEMLLSSEIKGFVPNPQYYFEKDDEEHRQALDLLMMIQGWRRFEWREMAVPNTKTLVHFAEDCPVVECKVMLNPEIDHSNIAGPLPDVLTATRVKPFDESAKVGYIKTVEGRHSFIMPLSFGMAEVMISAVDDTNWDKKSELGYKWFVKLPLPSLDVDNMKLSYGGAVPSAFVARINLPYPRFVKSYNYYQQRLAYDDEAMQPIVNKKVIKEFDDTYPALMVNAEDAWNYAMDCGMRSSSLEDVAKAYLGNSSSGKTQFSSVDVRFGNDISFSEDDITDEILDALFERGNLKSNKELAAENGALSDEQMLDVMMYMEKESQEKYVFYTDYQPRLADCISKNDTIPYDTQIAIYRHINKERIPLYRDRHLNMQCYAPCDSFYNRSYKDVALDQKPKDYRRTLYWNPCVKLDENGEAKIGLYNNGKKGRINVSAAGLSEMGTIIEY